MKPLVILALLFLPFASKSEEMNDQTVVEIPQGWAMSFNLGSASLNSELSTQGLGSTAFNFGMSFDYLKQDWYSSIMIDILEFDDDSKFKQDVVSNYGSDSTETSTASATSIGGAFGKAFFVNNNKTMLYAQGGANILFGASRAIDNCSNCYEDDLEVSGGLFARVGANIYSDNIVFGVYSSFGLSGDIDNVFGIKVGFQY